MTIICLFSSRCLITPMLGHSKNLLIHGMFLITMRSSKIQWVRMCLEACSLLLLSEIDIMLFLVTSSPGICFWYLFLVQVVCFALVSYAAWFVNLGSMTNECENVIRVGVTISACLWKWLASHLTWPPSPKLVHNKIEPFIWIQILSFANYETL